MPVKSVFISREKDTIQDLTQFTSEHQIDLVAHSFLSFEQVPYSVQKSFDIVFFGSPKAVQFFLDQEPVLSNCIIAAVGGSTAKVLEDRGITVSFIGEGSDIPKLADAFRNWVKGKSVLFPQSDRSLRSISSSFPKEQKEDLVVYKTLVSPFNIPEVDAYIFTSPSNVEGFFETNHIPENARVISWGSSTTESLNNKGIDAIQLDEPSIRSLISELKTL